jgi:hypothetical protein
MRALLLLAALSAAAFTTGVRAASAPSASCDAALPRDVAAWPVATQAEPHTLSPALRGRLARAAVAAFTPDAWAPLLAKLRRGEALTVVAFGSSIVADHAGAFVSSGAVLQAAGVQSLMPTFERELEETGAVRRDGYLAQFMRAVNATWPHPGHLLVNVGRGAVNLGMFVEALCTEQMLPLAAEVDLLLFESHSEDGEPAYAHARGAQMVELVERLYAFAHARMARGTAVARAIPLVMLSVLPVVKDYEGAMPRKTDEELCVGKHGARCGGCAPDVHTANLFGGSSLAGVEASLASAARRYGWAMISVRDGVAAGMRDGLHVAANASECEWINTFYADAIHPNFEQGRNLIADALLSLLVAAQDVAPPGCAATGGGEALPPPVARLPAPVTPGGWLVTPHACAEPAHIRPTRCEAWHLVRHELVKGAIVWKAGWVANTTGALLEFPFRTRVPELPDGARARLTLRYLTSYEGMGAAALACAGGCACEAAVLEGHVSGSVSVECDAHVEVTQADACTLQLRLLEETRSQGGHKFKLLGVTLSALPPPPPGARRRVS